MTKQEFMAMSLPYGLKCLELQHRGDKNGEIGTFTGYELDMFSIISDIRMPILRPLSELAKEIEHKGEIFIPMKKLFEYIDTNYFHEDPILKHIKFIPEKILSCEYKVYKWLKYTEVILMYREDYTNMLSHIKSFRYSPDIRRFLIRDETEIRPLGIAYQLDLFQKLIEWKFDVALLIDKNEAIDYSTLEGFSF
jgi:hypothetical protein